MRVRIVFSKQGALRYTGHLDLHKLWERAARRAQLQLSYSQGFHPQPKISLAAALPLGFSSRAEVLDLRLNEEMPLNEIAARFGDSLPKDIQIVSLDSVDERAPALQTQVLSAEYNVHLTEAREKSKMDINAEKVLGADSLVRERRQKKYDLRPLIEELSIVSEEKIFMRLAARDGATGRPEEVLDALGIPIEAARVERVRLIFQP